MSIIQELAEKYYGIYSEDLPKDRIIAIDGAKIRINLNQVNSAMLNTVPFQITLYLDKTYDTELTIFPKDAWNTFLDFILPKRRAFIPKHVLKQFWFGGNKKLLKQLTSDKFFIESIIDETIYIETTKKQTDRIVLTPAHGIKDINQFEKFVAILKRIEYKIKNSVQ